MDLFSVRPSYSMKSNIKDSLKLKEVRMMLAVFQRMVCQAT